MTKVRRLEVAELSLATLDALDVDALAVLVGPERPLQGLAGLVDWRLCGALTRVLTTGLYAGDPGEALLLPSAGRVPAARVVVLGLPSHNRPADFSSAVGRACDVLHRAGYQAFASGLPPVDGADVATAARLWLAATALAPPARQVLLGDPRILLPVLAAARAETGVAVDVAPFAARPGPMVR
jgi:hypothetical protein